MQISLRLLYLKVAEKNFRAYCLYKKHGYVEIANCEGVCVMIKML